MKKLICMLALVMSFSVHADVTCKGKIKRVYKWDYFETISFLMDNEGARWISLPSKSDEAMALMAFASNKNITVQWVDPAISTYNNGWSNNKTLKGWWSVDS